MVRSLTMAMCLSSFAAWAVCDSTNPTNPENDCDNDGCKVSQGDCGDTDTQIRGVGCPGGAVDEVCDGKDNNCAGGVDNGDPGGGGSCSTGQAGVCSAGTNHCTGGAIVCQRNTNPSAEVCDGLDNNCAGGVDENNPGGGGSCQTGQQGVCAGGTRQCTGGALVCTRTTNPSTETCDNQDNNCNGSTDEGFNVGAGCTSSNPGVCAPGTNVCQGNGTAACISTVTPGSRSETCNGLDDDCNGTVDNGNPGGGVGCTTSLPGRCSAGTSACTSGAIVCNPNQGPVTETCNGIDDDCDGMTDEGFNVGGSCASGNSGVCGPGTNQCQSNGTIACISTVTPGTRTETCNGLDDNCNGTVDEGTSGGACNSSNVGVCRPGTQTCSSGTITCNSTVAPGSRTETCNGLDDDCDGTTDEGFNVGGSCTAAAQGICANGTLACASGGGTQCNPRAAGTETCNGLDDNCNGTVDEGTGGAACNTANVGVCRAGTQVCTSGALSCTSTVAPGSRPETCNGQDDNCNGTTDEGFNVGANCSVGGQQGVCANGTNQCQGNGTVACIGPTATTETCNGLDDNCDGTVDNGNPGGGGTCTINSLQGACRIGRNNCTSGAISCTQTVFPTTETCDNIDNDCDGTVDEGFGAGTACTVAGQQGICATGTNTCQGNGTVACIGRTATTESCNGADDDCDGATDENDPGGGAMCNTGLMGACGPGVRRCTSGALTCVANVGSTTEVCDGADNDCDGQTDEGFDVDGDGAKACVGMCNVTGCDCDDTRATVKPGLSETCDGLDNNCNGSVDEGSGAGGKISRNCYSGPAGTQGVGVCVAGVQACNSTTPGMASFGACTNEVTPTAETCNTRDDDCDNTVDENFDVDGDGFRSCTACNLTANCDCNDNDPAIKPGAVEVCDAVDQNCNGQLDDVPTRKCFAGAGVTPDTYTGTCPGSMCTPKGVCTTGTQTCSTQGAWGACAGPTLPVTESCDNLDNDCDGTVDNGNFDVDMDGVRLCNGDCNDNDPAIKPGAPEICDNKDNDCDGTTDGVATSCYSGPVPTRSLGICRDGTQTCTNGMGTGTCAGEIVPTLLADGGVPVFVPDGGANDPELLCDGRDEDCDGIIDDGFDLDGDGVTTCAGDCDDTNAFNRPGALEICDCQDNNCNTQIDEVRLADGGLSSSCVGAPCHDFDGDGITNCQGDCNDTRGAGGAIGPQFTEKVGNGIDDDCDGAIDEDTDEDGDGFSTAQGDCNDRIAAVNPGAVEVCDGFDNDCDGVKDEGFDQDGDFASVCAGDCDDTDPNRSPFKTEVCGNMVDDNCDGRVDEDTDADMDGVTTCQGDCNDFNPAVHPANMSGGIAEAPEICDGQVNNCVGGADLPFDLDHDFQATCFGDCDDTNPNVNSGVYEIAGNMIDDDCDGLVDEGGEDRDMDGFSSFCGDCNDADPAINPHASEICDRVDNNCDAYVDSAPGRFDLCAVCFDADRDGVTNCAGDCNDADPSIYRGAPELCDLKDNDCDGDTDLDPATGLRVCMVDEDGGSIIPDAGTDGGPIGGGGGTSTGGGTGSDGGPTLPTVTTGCGCSSGADLAPLALLGLAALGRRARRRSKAMRLPGISVVLVLSLVALTGCSTSLKTPPVADAGGDLDAGDDLDAGLDAGPFIPNATWNCPGLYPVETVLDGVPGSTVYFAHSKAYAVTRSEAGGLVVYDDPQRQFAGFSLRRSAPADLDLTQPNALETFAAREITALNNLQGTPLVRDSIERFTRIYRDARMQRNYSTGVTYTFATPTDAFSARNRLVTQLSNRTQAEIGTLPTVPTALVQDQLVTYLAFRINGDQIFITGAVSRLDDFRTNQPALGDFTNGSHLSAPDPILNYACETINAPPLKTDFIFVVDNSASMLEEQTALVNSADALFNAFQASGIDFRIGVVTTDSEVLHGNGFTNDLNQFKSDVRVGINGNGFEMGVEFGLRAIRRAKLSGIPANYAVREEAGLVVVFVSDEENAGLQPISTYGDEYVAENAVAFGIVGPRPIGCTRVGLGQAVAGTEYIDLANATGGSTGSICNPNITEVVEEILFGAIGASSRATLMNRPISGSLSARIGMDMPVPRARVNGFDYDPANNTLLFFGVLPADGSDVTAAYATFDYLQ